MGFFSIKAQTLCDLPNMPWYHPITPILSLEAAGGWSYSDTLGVCISIRVLLIKKVGV